MPSYTIKTFTIDVNTMSNVSGIYFATKELNAETWYSSAKAIIPLFARKSGYSYVCDICVNYETLRVQSRAALTDVIAAILVIS